MDGLDIAAFAIMATIAAMAVGVFVFLGSWPGRIARRLNHPYTNAIAIGGWVTLIFGAVGWPFVLIWAHAPPGGEPVSEASDDESDAPEEG